MFYTFSPVKTLSQKHVKNLEEFHSLTMQLSYLAQRGPPKGSTVKSSPRLVVPPIFVVLVFPFFSNQLQILYAFQKHDFRKHDKCLHRRLRIWVLFYHGHRQQHTFAFQMFLSPIVHFNRVLVYAFVLWHRFLSRSSTDGSSQSCPCVCLCSATPLLVPVDNTVLGLPASKPHQEAARSKFWQDNLTATHLLSNGIYMLPLTVDHLRSLGSFAQRFLCHQLVVRLGSESLGCLVQDQLDNIPWNVLGR